jgi:hypothetical protein
MPALPVKPSDSPATCTISSAPHAATFCCPAQRTRPLSSRLAALVGAVSASGILLGSVLMLFDASTAAAAQVERRMAAPLWDCSRA